MMMIIVVFIIMITINFIKIKILNFHPSNQLLIIFSLFLF